MPSDKLSGKTTDFTYKTLGLVFLALTSVMAASKKPASPVKTTSTIVSPLKPAAETVYVSTPIPSQAEFNSSASNAKTNANDKGESDDRRKRIPPMLGPLRNFENAYGLAAGFYSAEVLGNNPFINLYGDFYSKTSPLFLELSTGAGTVQSALAEDIVGGGVFKNNLMLTFEALGGYTYTGLAPGPGQAGGLYPYFMAGMTALYQGGIPNIGAVLAFGNRMHLPFGPTNGRWSLNYGVRDHIYSQKIRRNPSLTQNFVLLIGVQKYY